MLLFGAVDQVPGDYERICMTLYCEFLIYPSDCSVCSDDEWKRQTETLAKSARISSAHYFGAGEVLLSHT